MHDTGQAGDPQEYGESYYASHCGEEYERSDKWLAFFSNAAERIVSSLHPTTTLDVGCAYGFLVEQLAKRGVAASGIDFSEYAIGKVDDSVKATCRVASATEPIDGRYDLITTIEMLEHLAAPDARRAINNMAAATDTILVSTTPHDHVEPTHINVQPPEYWASQFAEEGFYRDLSFDASYITPWAVLYRRGQADAAGLVLGYERELFRAHTERDQLRAETKRLWSVIDAGREANPQTKQLAQAEDRFAQQQTSIDQLTQDLWSSRDALEGAMAARGSALAKLGVATGELESLRAEQGEWDTKLAAIHIENAALEAELDAIKKSRSWRLVQSGMAAGKLRRRLRP